jgi:hypothetical protein
MFIVVIASFGFPIPQLDVVVLGPQGGVTGLLHRSVSCFSWCVRRLVLNCDWHVCLEVG